MSLVIQGPTGAGLVLAKPTGASLLVSAKQYIPAVIGEPFGGGYFAGYISHTADGNPTHALIVAPRATGATGTGYTLTTNYAWGTAPLASTSATSSFDGAANTAALVTAGISKYPAAQFCTNLSIGGFTDWYLPARYELDIAYFNLKPATTSNVTTVGTNSYAVPARSLNYTAGYPAQTYVTSFNTSAEQFVSDFHWSSTQVDPNNAGQIRMNDAFYHGVNKETLFLVRAFRRIAL